MNTPLIYRLIKTSLQWYHNVWWKFMPGVTIKVKWPNGPVFNDFIDQYKSNDQLLSADPNDHYKPWMEKHVGKQGWDWNWTLTDNDIEKNCLTIKFRKGKESHATIAKMRWS